MRNLSLDPDTLPSPEGVEILARNHVAAGSEPVMLGAPTTRAPGWGDSGKVFRETMHPHFRQSAKDSSSYKRRRIHRFPVGGFSTWTKSRLFGQVPTGQLLFSNGKRPCVYQFNLSPGKSAYRQVRVEGHNSRKPNLAANAVFHQLSKRRHVCKRSGFWQITAPQQEPLDAQETDYAAIPQR